MLSPSTHRPSTPTVTFFGAAQTVTGSMHLLEAAGRRVLLDCGMFRGPRDEARQRNSRFPFEPADIDAVVLSHAHTDHCGNLPNLIRQGFAGPIYCTPATRDLIAIMLADSARIQEEDAAVARLAGRPPELRKPLYTRADAAEAVSRCVAVPLEQPHDIDPSIRLRFRDAGHILGAAMVSLTVAGSPREHRVTFTGDLGRRGLPFLHQPQPVPPGDLIISESTYGGRRHDTLEGMAAKMSDLVRRTAARGGKVLIPAFSLGRTQIVAHFLQVWMRDGLLPRMPIYIDSPLAIDIGEVYRRYAATDLVAPPPEEPEVEYVMSPEEADYLTTRPEPAIFVASGGMCEGGRIVHHLRRHIDDPRATIILVSYQAPNTVGRQLLELRPTVRFHGRNWNKWAEVAEINGFSGHADHDDFLALLAPAAEEAQHVRLVHGEPQASEALAKALRERGVRDVAAPHRGDGVALA
jgi:metallo-beta-lactamase family protein